MPEIVPYYDCILDDARYLSPDMTAVTPPPFRVAVRGP